ncbi:MAG: hypothetical protein H0X62_01620 [Bacteroidetes bacterium]|nr:hypothetical protein [Bacteroidota bacterium]
MLEIHNKYYDNRWEQEWRIANELIFEMDDIAFVIVPDNIFKEFEDWALNEEIEITMVPASLYTNSLDFLKMIPNSSAGLARPNRFSH